MPILRRAWWVAVVVPIALCTNVHAADNSWIGTTDRWDTNTAWSLGLPPDFTQSIYITNAGTKTITVDGSTAINASNTLSVTNLTLSAPSNSLNTLLLTNVGTIPLSVHENFTLLSGGALTATNSIFAVDCARPPVGATDNNSHVQLDGPVVFNRAEFNASNAFQTMLGGTLGGGGVGTLNMTNSTFKGYKLFIGYYSDATANFVNSTSRLGDRLNIADVNGHTGKVSVIGGQFIVTNTAFGPDTVSAIVGGRGSGQLIVSNATVQFNVIQVGTISGADGTFNFQNGTLTARKAFLGLDSLTNNFSSKGTLTVSGGQMLISELHAGQYGTGLVTVAGGFLSNSLVVLSENSNSFGSLTINGGTHLVSSALIVGSNTPASVSLHGGSLLVTNAAGTALLKLDGSPLIQSAGTLKADNLVLTNGGSLVTSSSFIVALNPVATNTLTISGGTLISTNGIFGVGNTGNPLVGTGNGSVTVSNGTLVTSALFLGNQANGSGSLTVQSNGFVNVLSNMTVAAGGILSTSSVSVLGGALTITNGLLSVGANGAGQLNLAGGTTTIKQLKLGSSAFGAGSGTLTLSSNAHLRILSSISANLIVIGGGDLDGSGGTVIIGEDHDAAMALSSGQVTNVANMYVGYSSGFTGSLNVQGGTLSVKTNFIVGDCLGSAVGVTTLSGGITFVTNAAHNAVLDVRYGTLVLNNGATLVVDALVITNSCGHFINNGGTVLAATVVLDPNMDADGDGQSNGNEAAAGTDPLDPSSLFRLTSIAKTGTRDVRVDWTTVGGHNYVVQIITNTSGSLTGNFIDLSGVITIGGFGPGTTSYTHVDGATNKAAYYRVRLNP